MRACEAITLEMHFAERVTSFTYSKDTKGFHKPVIKIITETPAQELQVKPQTDSKQKCLGNRFYNARLDMQNKIFRLLTGVSGKAQKYLLFTSSFVAQEK